MFECINCMELWIVILPVIKNLSILWVLTIEYMSIYLWIMCIIQNSKNFELKSLWDYESGTHILLHDPSKKKFASNRFVYPYSFTQMFLIVKRDDKAINDEQPLLIQIQIYTFSLSHSFGTYDYIKLI